MSSRRRRHSGPPPQSRESRESREAREARQTRHYLRRESYPDDEHDWHLSDYPARANGPYTERLPPLAYEPSYPRSGTWPDDGSELEHRGRAWERGHRPPPAAAFHEPRKPEYKYDESPSHRPRRPRSHDRISPGASPPRHRHHHRRRRPSPSRHAGIPRAPSTTPRSKSVSSSGPRHQKRQTTASELWQNPIIRTCAITAITTGLSAALDSRGDPGQWKGAKGAKVAVASLGSALVDGFLGQRHPNSVRQDIVRKGVQVAMEETEKKKREPREGSREGSREGRKDDAPRPQDASRRRRHSEGERSHGRHH